MQYYDIKIDGRYVATCAFKDEKDAIDTVCKERGVYYMNGLNKMRKMVEDMIELRNPPDYNEALYDVLHLIRKLEEDMLEDMEAEHEHK